MRERRTTLERPSLSSAQLMEMSPSLTPRHIQNWDEKGIISATRYGHQRRYSVERAATVFVIHRLRQVGISLQRLRKPTPFVLEFFQKSGVPEVLVAEIDLKRSPPTVMNFWPVGLGDLKDRYFTLSARNRCMFTIDLAAFVQVPDSRKRACGGLEISKR